MSLPFTLLKMKTEVPSIGGDVSYFLKTSNEPVGLNKLTGQKISIKHTGLFFCIGCTKSIPKTYQQGYCFVCTQKLAETDLCIVKPSLCHFDKGTCRDETFAKEHCFIPHTVYLSLTSQPKIGITRRFQKLNRWADQGATLAIEVLIVKNRKMAGEIEELLGQFLSDKTQWQKMLLGEVANAPLAELKHSLLPQLEAFEDWELAPDDLYALRYPLLEYPSKIKSLSLEKTPQIEDTLMGIKGQYLIFKSGVLNIRKHQGYQIEFTV